MTNKIIKKRKNSIFSMFFSVLLTASFVLSNFNGVYAEAAELVKAISLVNYYPGECVFQNMPYSLPQTTTANMSDGSKVEVPISWSPSTADFTNVGTYTFTGTVEGITRKVNMRVSVYSPIDLVQGGSASVLKDDSYTLPSNVTVRLSNGSWLGPLSVVWNTSTVDTSIPGTYTFEGTIKNFTGKYILTLNVKPRANIVSINNVNVDVNHNSSYTLPKTVSALMDDGSYNSVAVTWNPSTVDTSKIGNFTYSGKVQGYNNDVTLTVDVISEISSIEDINKTVYQNSAYSLPDKVSAFMSDGTKKELSVTWDSTNVDTSIIGTTNFKGTVQGYSNTVTLTLSVKEKSDITSIEYLAGDTVFQNMPYSLPQTTKATLSDGSIIDVPITWSPSIADLSKTGSFNYVGTVEGYSTKMNFSLYVFNPIVSVREISASVYQNDTYTLPKSVMAVLNNNTAIGPINVTWNTLSTDTSKIGVYTYEGTIKNYTGKATLTLTVKSRISVDDIITSVEQNATYQLPQKVIGHVCDGTTVELPVTWNPSAVDTSTIGSHIFEGTVEGYYAKVKLNLFVRGEGMVYIPDKNLEAAIRTAISKPTGDIMESDMINITFLDLKYKGIVNLEGLQFAKNLKVMYLTSNELEDISQIKYLTNLKALYLNDNKIKDISPLSSLASLQSLSLGDNSITDISPLGNLMYLEDLDVTRNKIKDISSMYNLKNSLTGLHLGQCGIEDISVLSGFTKLVRLSLENNYIKDINGLSKLMNLTNLNLSDNLVDDYTSLASLNNVTSLDLSGNNITDYSSYYLFNDNIKIDFWGFFQTKSEIATFMGRADEIIASVITPEMTDYEKEKALHDYICTHTVYTLGVNKGAYGILIDGKGSCDAFSDAMNLLLNKIGIKCIKIRGLAGSEPHAWNIVMIDGKYYHLDTTWDTYYTNVKGDLCTTYFNVSDTFMLTERKWDKSKYPICE